MSHQAFVDFYCGFIDSPAGEAARDELGAICDRQSFAARMVALGASAGFEFTAEEVIAVMDASHARAMKLLAAANGELDEAQLEGVVGGAFTSAAIPTIKLTYKELPTAGLWTLSGDPHVIK